MLIDNAKILSMCATVSVQPSITLKLCNSPGNLQLPVIAGSILSFQCESENQLQFLAAATNIQPFYLSNSFK